MLLDNFLNFLNSFFEEVIVFVDFLLCHPISNTVIFKVDENLALLNLTKCWWIIAYQRWNDVFAGCVVNAEECPKIKLLPLSTQIEALKILHVKFLDHVFTEALLSRVLLFFEFLQKLLFNLLCHLIISLFFCTANDLNLFDIFFFDIFNFGHVLFYGDLLPFLQTVLDFLTASL